MYGTRVRHHAFDRSSEAPWFLVGEGTSEVSVSGTPGLSTKDHFFGRGVRLNVDALGPVIAAYCVVYRTSVVGTPREDIDMLVSHLGDSVSDASSVQECATIYWEARERPLHMPGFDCAIPRAEACSDTDFMACVDSSGETFLAGVKDRLDGRTLVAATRVSAWSAYQALGILRQRVSHVFDMGLASEAAFAACVRFP